MEVSTNIVNPPPLLRSTKYKAPQERTTKPHVSPVLHTIYDREVRQIEPLKVSRFRATLYRRIPLGKLLQYGPSKSINPREAVGQYFPNTNEKHDKKTHEVDQPPP